MTNVFQFGGPVRFKHQRAALQSLIDTHGRTALLLDPGLGKTAVVLDYASLLALKAQAEVRLLVVCPLAAVDTWVDQAKVYISPQVSFWAEALGGTLFQRAEALAARGDQPYPRHLAPKQRRETLVPKPAGTDPRALHWKRSWSWAARAGDQEVTDMRLGPAQLPDTRVLLTVINIDTLSQRSAVGSSTMADILLDAVKRYRPDMLVIDESHKIKGPSANGSRLLARMVRTIPRRVLLTGTVMPHGPLDVYAQWRALEPSAFSTRQMDGSRKPMSFGSFKARYALTGGWMGKEVIGYQRLEEMQDIMARNSIVVRKKDALDLPPTTDSIVHVELSPAELAAYADMKAKLAVQLADGTFSNAASRLTQMLRLRQITAGHLPADDGSVKVIGHSKANTIRSLVHDSLVGEKRIVVFAYFKEEIRQLAEALSMRGTEVQVITGDTPVEERTKLRKRFGSNDPQRMVMIAQIRTMSLAVNELVTANHAIFASLSQQRDDLVQGRDRLDRIGQTRPVTFWYALAPNTVDQVILDTHQQRGDLEAAVLRHIKGD